MGRTDAEYPATLKHTPTEDPSIALYPLHARHSYVTVFQAKQTSCSIIFLLLRNACCHLEAMCVFTERTFFLAVFLEAITLPGSLEERASLCGNIALCNSPTSPGADHSLLRRKLLCSCIQDISKHAPSFQEQTSTENPGPK